MALGKVCVLQNAAFRLTGSDFSKPMHRSAFSIIHSFIKPAGLYCMSVSTKLEDTSLLGCTVESVEWFLISGRIITPSSRVKLSKKMEAARSFKIPEITHLTTQRNISEILNCWQHCYEKLKSCNTRFINKYFVG